MKTTKLIVAIFFVWACSSYILITQLYKKSVAENHSIIANVLSRTLIQDAILNDLIKIKASISDFLDSAQDVSFICITSGDNIIAYVGDTEINHRNANEKECSETKISTQKADVIKIFNNHDVPISDLKIFWKQENISFVWIKQNPIIFIGALVLLGLLLATLKFVFNREQGLLLESSIHELIKNQEPSEYLKKRFPYLASKWLEMKNTVDLLSIERIKNEKAASIAELAAQVSHDIRSPLSALTILMGNINELPENKRILARNAIQRINDIANSLIEKSKESSRSVTSNLMLENPSDKATELVSAVVDSIVSEKRLQFRDYLGVEIDCEIKNSYGAFAEFNSLEIKRVISNLINNSVEAFSDHKGKVFVSVNTGEAFIEIIIKDNGCGIPEQIIRRVGEQGFSFGKENTESGSGLGIYHAKQTIDKLGGKFLIESKKGVGTTITISMPKAIAPFWFVEKLSISQSTTIVVCDDDVSIHQIWSGRFKALFGDGYQIISFSNGDLFKKWIIESGTTDFICLVDYELINQSSNGLDIIDELQIQSKAILVTSRYDEVKIRDRAKKINLKMIPKAMVPYIPINELKARNFYSACLIDDDPIIRMTWKLSAKESGAKILIFENFDEFLKEAETINLQTPIYIDQNLANGEKGTDIAINISNIGFKKLILATGYEPGQLDAIPDCVSRVVGKDPVL